MKTDPDVTIFMDCNDDELSQLSDLSVKYLHYGTPVEYEPGLYGIVSGFKYDEENMDYSWWEVTSYPVSCEEFVLRIPMTDNMANSNYAGIAGYPFYFGVVNYRGSEE